MKTPKLISSLLIMLMTICVAQEKEIDVVKNLQNQWIKALETQGYKSSIDKDGDITFNWGDNFFILINPNDPHFLNLLLPTNHKFKDGHEKAKALQALNEVNKRYKATKIVLKGTENHMYINLQNFCDSPSDFSPFFKRSIKSLQESRNAFIKAMQPEKLFQFYNGDGKHGFENSNEEIVIKATWDNVRDFSEGFAGVKLDDQWAFIDKSGKLVFKDKWKYVGSFKDGKAKVFTKHEVKNPKRGLNGSFDFDHFSKEEYAAYKKKFPKSEQYNESSAQMRAVVSVTYYFINKKGEKITDEKSEVYIQIG